MVWETLRYTNFHGSMLESHWECQNAWEQWLREQESQQNFGDIIKCFVLKIILRLKNRTVQVLELFGSSLKPTGILASTKSKADCSIQPVGFVPPKLLSHLFVHNYPSTYRGIHPNSNRQNLSLNFPLSNISPRIWSVPCFVPWTTPLPFRSINEELPHRITDMKSELIFVVAKLSSCGLW